MTAPQTIAIDTIDEDRKYGRAAIEAIGGDPQRARPGHMPGLIARYAQSLRRGASLPAIVLIRAGDGRLFLYDGHHRLNAHKECGRTEIDAVVYQEKDFLAVLPLAAQTLSQGQRSALLYRHIK